MGPNNSFQGCSTSHSVYRDKKITPPTGESDVQLFTTFCALNESLQVAQKRVEELTTKYKQEVHKLEALKEKRRELREVNKELRENEPHVPRGWLRENNYGA